MIGGKVVDASAFAALVRGRPAAVAGFAMAKTAGLTLYLPALALAGHVVHVGRTRGWVS